jgi:murein L,D-transpeptidase YafK
MRPIAALALCLSIALSAALAGGAGAARAELPKAEKLVVFKAKRTLHLVRDGWVFRAYRIKLGDKPVGPKIFQYDGRTPEGRYVIDYRNASSRFHRSLHISYPRPEDVARARRYGTSPGGDIFIHGTPGEGVAYAGDWTNGCIALKNHEIDELWRAVDDGTPIEIRP